jgi:hypothetical protein
MSADPRFTLNPPWPDLPHVNAVLHGRGRHYHVESYRTTLSLKSVLQGEATWRTRRGRFRLDASALVVLNHGQEYALDFTPGMVTETLCLFFAPGFLEAVRPGVQLASRALLDDPDGTGREVEIVERLHAKEGVMAAALADLQRTVRAPHVDPARLEDGFWSAAAAIVQQHDRTRAEMLAFPAPAPPRARSSTVAFTARATICTRATTSRSPSRGWRASPRCLPITSSDSSRRRSAPRRCSSSSSDACR